MTRFGVLLVDDDPSDRLLVSLVFAQVAPRVGLFTARDGEEGIAYLAGTGKFGDREAHPLPQLVLLDLKMPRKSGFEVLEWIRGGPTTRDLPVIVLTSSQDGADLDRAYALGANSYLVKSVDLDSMREVIRGIGEYAVLLGAKAPGRKTGNAEIGRAANV